MKVSDLINKLSLINRKFGLVILLSLPSLIWILKDRSSWHWDQSYYARYSLNLYDTLLNRPSQWHYEMISAVAFKAPGITWLGQFFVPIGQMFNNINAGLLISTLLSYAISIYLLMKSSRKLFGNTCSVISGLVLAASPLALGLSHEFFVESFQMLAVVLVIYLATNSHELNRYKLILGIISISAFALMLKVSSPIYFFLITLIPVYYVIKPNTKSKLIEQIKDKGFLIHLAFTTFIVLITALYYYKNWSTMVSFLDVASHSKTGEYYSIILYEGSKYIYWTKAFAKTTSLQIVAYYWVFILIAYFSSEFKQIKNRNYKLIINSIFSRKGLIASISALTIIINLVIFSQQTNEETRYILPLIPFFALFVTFLISQIGSTLLTKATISIMIFQFVLISAISLNVIKYSQLNVTEWLRPYESSAKHLNELKRIVNETCKTNSVVLVLNSNPNLNHDNMQYLAAEQSLNLENPLTCTFYPPYLYGRNNLESHWSTIESLDSNIQYLIIFDEQIPLIDNSTNQNADYYNSKLEMSEFFSIDRDLTSEEIHVYKRSH